MAKRSISKRKFFTYKFFSVKQQENPVSLISSVVSCVVPVGNVTWMLFQEGRSSKLRLRRGVDRLHTLAIIPTSSVLEFVVHKQWIMVLQVNYSDFKSRGVCLFITTLTDRPASIKAACQRSRKSADCNCSTRQLLLHSWPHTLLARPHLNKKK